MAFLSSFDFKFVDKSQIDAVVPSISIIAVQPDEWVEIETKNFPAADTFLVTMGAIGTKGIRGINVSTVYTGAGGSLIVRLQIPFALNGLEKIAVRLESSTSGYYAYSWFENSIGVVPITLAKLNTDQISINVEWPSELEVGETGIIKIAVYRKDTQSSIDQVLDGYDSISATPMPISGSQFASIEEEFGDDYTVCIVPKMILSHSVISVSDKDECFSLDTTYIVKEWIISPEKSGRQPVILRLDFSWVSRQDETGGGQTNQTIIWRESINIEVAKSPFIVLGQINLGALITALLIAITSSALAAPFLYRVFQDRKKSEDETLENDDSKPKILLP